MSNAMTPCTRALALLKANDPAEAMAVLTEHPDHADAACALAMLREGGLVPFAEAILEFGVEKEGRG